MEFSIELRGYLKGHNGWVTAIATHSSFHDVILSASRDKTIIVWKLETDPDNPSKVGVPKKALRGHGHFVSDVKLSSDCRFALSSSWDRSLRLWDLSTGQTTCRFVGHSNDVLSVDFSSDNRFIVSGSRDRTIKLWNTLGECQNTMIDEGHTEWVSSVRFSPSTQNPIIVSSSWDRMVKVWNLTSCTLRTTLAKHTGYLNAVTVSPDGSLCASGGKDGVAILWDLQQGVYLFSLEANDIIHALCFSPNRYWLCAATNSCVKVWNLESKFVVGELRDELDGSISMKARQPACISLAWSADGSTLFAGYTDNVIRVWNVKETDTSANIETPVEPLGIDDY